MAFLDEFRHLIIRLEEIKLATNNFGENNIIGNGGFGKVYKGEISHYKGRSMVAIKRLDRRYGQGDPEFWKEIIMLSRHTHENLISLLGYCDEGDEKILVYEHASRGSLDRHLSATSLTWRQRLKICLAAARGLSYLHDPKGTQQRVLHRDIKSANVLLDENWNAKLSDLGLSKMGPANQQHTVLVSNAVGTPGYCDPLYMETFWLTKESDVYSFGVVLFEVLCGRLCFGYSKGRCEILVPMWKQSYQLKKLDEIIFQDLKRQMDSSSLEIFSDIAYQCLQRAREERPTMDHVVGKLEIALEFQEISEGVEQPKDYEKIIKTEVPALIYRSKEELIMLLSKGILVNRGKTWFSLNKNEEHIEMISAAECFIPVESGPLHDECSSKYNSRFAEGGYRAYFGRFKTNARTRFLSPQITYTVNLVFKFFITKKNSSKPTYFALKYKLEGETKPSISYLADGREDGWMTAELYQFTSDTRDFDLEILFEGSAFGHDLIVEGIEFRPLEKVEHDVIEDEKVDMQLISYSDIDWDQKLPNDYEEIMKWSKDSMEWTTQKELYFLFCKGFLVNNGDEWFSLAKNGKKCPMLSARAALREYQWIWESLPESRFEEVAFNRYGQLSIVCKIKPQLLSSQTTYACYLVYNITENHSEFEAPLKVMDKDFNLNNCHLVDFWFIYLLIPQTPVIRPKVDQNTNNPSDMPKIKGLPRLRNDGWMEVQVWEFQTSTTINEVISMDLDFNSVNYTMLNGLIVQGIEFMPL